MRFVFDLVSGFSVLLISFLDLSCLAFVVVVVVFLFLSSRNTLLDEGTNDTTTRKKELSHVLAAGRYHRHFQLKLDAE